MARVLGYCTVSRASQKDTDVTASCVMVTQPRWPQAWFGAGGRWFCRAVGPGRARQAWRADGVKGSAELAFLHRSTAARRPSPSGARAPPASPPHRGSPLCSLRSLSLPHPGEKGCSPASFCACPVRSPPGDSWENACHRHRATSTLRAPHRPTANGPECPSSERLGPARPCDVTDRAAGAGGAGQGETPQPAWCCVWHLRAGGVENTAAFQLALGSACRAPRPLLLLAVSPRE